MKETSRKVVHNVLFVVMVSCLSVGIGGYIIVGLYVLHHFIVKYW